LFNLVQTLAILYFYGLPYMWKQTGAVLELLSGKTGYSVLQHEITHTIAFLLAVTVISMVLEMPWGLYSTFVVEQKHGFNKQTLGLYFSDIAKQASSCWGMPHPALLPQVHVDASASRELSCCQRPGYHSLLITPIAPGAGEPGPVRTVRSSHALGAGAALIAFATHHALLPLSPSRSSTDAGLYSAR
jgi:hypothetical protein